MIFFALTLGNDIQIYTDLICFIILLCRYLHQQTETVMNFDFKSILDLVKAFPDEQTCMEYLAEMRWNGEVVSPFDSTSKVYKCAGLKFKCKNTGKYFTAKVGTIFEDTKIPLIKWYMALYIFSSHKKGVSSHQLAKDIDVTQKTAWFMLHRLRFAFNAPSFNAEFEGIVEIDETYMGGDDKNKHEYKKSHKKGRNNDTKTPVVGMLQREVSEIVEREDKLIPGKIVRERVIKSTSIIKCEVAGDTTAKTVHPIVLANICPTSTIVTDEYKVYNGLDKNFQHAKVNHGAKEYVNEMAHTNGVENFWSHLKRGVDGIYHWVSTQHLQSYVNEYTLRFNTRKFTTAGRFDLVLANVAGRLTYKELTK